MLLLIKTITPPGQIATPGADINTQLTNLFGNPLSRIRSIEAEAEAVKIDPDDDTHDQ